MNWMIILLLVIGALGLLVAHFTSENKKRKQLQADLLAEQQDQQRWNEQLAQVVKTVKENKEKYR